MIRPYGNIVVPRNTPMHVEALVLHILREVFKEIGPEDYPFRLTDDPETTRMLIDTEYNKVSEIIGKKPILVVSTGPTSSGPQVLSDLATSDLITGGRNEKTNLARSSIRVGAYGRTRSEAFALGQELFNALAMSRAPLVALAGLQNISDFSLSEPMLMRQDTKVYVCQAGFSYFLQYKWTEVYTPQVLNEIGLFINNEFTLDLSEEQ